MVGVQPLDSCRHSMKIDTTRCEGETDCHRLVIVGHDETSVGRSEEELFEGDNIAVTLAEMLEHLKAKGESIGLRVLLSEFTISYRCCPAPRTFHSLVSALNRCKAPLWLARCTIFMALISSVRLVSTIHTDAQLPQPT